jgi:calcineurin-like phosphoesterase family protein
VEEMNKALMDNWNARVTQGDTIYVCGDLMFRLVTDPKEFLDRLKGKKHLIVVNHDSSWMKKVELSSYFESVELMQVINNGRAKITLCHYPMMSYEGEYLIHGHIHTYKNDTYWELLQSMDTALNASVEINGYAPVTFEELISNTRAFKAEK